MERVQLRTFCVSPQSRCEYIFTNMPRLHTIKDLYLKCCFNRGYSISNQRRIIVSLKCDTLTRLWSNIQYGVPNVHVKEWFEDVYKTSNYRRNGDSFVRSRVFVTVTVSKEAPKIYSFLTASPPNNWKLPKTGIIINPLYQSKIDLNT